MITKTFSLSLKALATALAAVLCALAPASAQAQVTVKGKVTDASGLEQPGTVVYVKGDLTNGTMTLADGSYSISVPDTKAVLVFSLMGFKDSEQTVGNRRTINVVLEDDSTVLSEVLVVGYGTQKKEFVVGSVSQVNSKDLLKAPNTNVSTMLAGRLSGMTAIQTTGIPGGDAASLLVRGISTFNNSSPLIIVDGVERSMTSLNPNDIASVTVLKDAATAAIYGVKAANGVVLVTTKTGNAGATNIVYDGSVSFDTNTVTPDLLTADEYIYWHNKAREMDNQTPYWTEERIASLKERGLYGETDNWALLYKKFGFTQQHNITATGGTDKINYYTSIGYMDQDGIMRNTSYKRYNVRANVTAKLAKGLKYNINMSAANANRSWPGLSMFSNGTWQGEFSPLRQACYAIPILKTTYEGLPLGFTNGTYTYTPEAANNTGFQKIDQWTAEIRSILEYDFTESGLEFLKGLKVGINFAYNFDYTLSRNYLESFQLYSYDPNTDTVTQKTSLGISENNFNKSHSVGYNNTIRPQITYDRDFGKHHVSGILLSERYLYHGDTMTGYKNGYSEGSPIDLTMGMKDSSSPVSGSYSDTGAFSIAGRLGYVYDKRYLAEFTFREDASFKFAPDKRWGFFPSIALGWVISQEEWMQDITWLDHLKLRTSVGVLGSDDTSAFLYMQSYKSTAPSYTYVINGTPTYTYYTTGYLSDDLTWSSTKTYNVGFEAKMFGNRLSIDLDAFYKYTDHILEYSSVGVYSPSLGGNNPSWKNSGIVDNKGFDMTTSWGDAFGDGWSYTITGILSYAHNRILKTDLVDDHPAYRSVLGQPMGSYYGFHATGLFQTQEQVDSYPTAPSGYAQLGCIMYEDINGDGKINSTYDFVKIGRSSTPEMTFSMNFDIAYRNLSLSALFQGATLCNYSLNGWWSNGNLDNTMYTRAFYGGGNSLRYLVEDSWTPENTDAKYPRLAAKTNANNAWASDWWIRDGSYVRLKNMQLAYDFPAKWLTATPLTGFRVFVAGTNLFTISSFKYIDPENPGINNGYYPQQRTVSCGVKATF